MARMTAPTLRPATRHDAAAIRDIYAPNILESAISFELEVPSEDEMARRIEAVSGRVPWLVAERGGDVAGYAYATTYRAREAYRWTLESSVYVHADHRGAGVARTLMVELIDVVRRLGYRTLVAGATLPNQASVDLHASLGFETSGVISRAGRKFDAWHDVAFWTLDLGGPDDPPEPLPPSTLHPSPEPSPVHGA